MADNRDAYVKFGYDVDEASINRAIARAGSVNTALSAQQKSLTGVAAAAKQAGDAFTTANKKALDALYEEVKALDKVRQAEQKAADAASHRRLERYRAARKEELSKGPDESGGNAGSANALRFIGPAFSTARNLQQGDIGGTVIGITRLASEAREAAQTTNILAGGVKQLAIAGGLAGIAIGGIALALSAFNKQIEAGQTLLKDALDAQVKYYADVNQLTTKQAEERLTNEKRVQNGLASAIKETQAQIDAQITELRKQAAGSEGADLALDQNAIQNPAIKQLVDHLKELQTQADTSGQYTERLSQGLKASVFATNDAIEAEKKLTEERQKRFEDRYSREIEGSKLIADGNANQIRERIRGMQTEIAANDLWLEKNAERIAGDSDLAEKYQAVQKANDKLKDDLDDLSQRVLPAVIEREKQSANHRKENTENLNTLEDKHTAILAREAEFAEKAAAAMNDFADETQRVAEERSIAAKREGQDFSIKRLRDQTNFAKQQADSDAAYYKDRGKRIAAFNAEQAKSENQAQKAELAAAQEANTAQLRAAEDFAARIRGLQESITDAGANLDAIGVRNAQRQLKEATDQYSVEGRRRDEDNKKRLADMREAAKEQQDERLAAFAQELADGDAQHAEQRRKEQDAFREQQRIEDEDRRLRLQRQAEDNARQDAARKTAFDRQIANLQSQLLYPEEKAKLDSYARQKAALNAFLSGSEAQLSAARTATTNATRTDTLSNANRSASISPVTVASQSNRTSLHTLAGFAGGGNVPVGVPVYINELGREPVVFHQPATVYPAGSKMDGGGVNFNGPISFSGTPPEGQVRSQWENFVRELFSMRRQ